MLDIVVKPFKQNKDRIIWVRTIKLGTPTSYDKRKTPFAFQGQGSTVKVKCSTLLLNLVNKVKTELFQLGLSNLVYILLMTRGKNLLLFSSPELKGRVSYCHSAPSVIRPSVRPSSSSVWRKLFTFSTSSPEPLDRFWWNLVGMKYSWSLTSVVVFRPDPPRGGSRAGPK